MTILGTSSPLSSLQWQTSIDNKCSSSCFCHQNNFLYNSNYFSVSMSEEKIRSSTKRNMTLYLPPINLNSYSQFLPLLPIAYFSLFFLYYRQHAIQDEMLVHIYATIIKHNLEMRVYIFTFSSSQNVHVTKRHSFNHKILRAFWSYTCTILNHLMIVVNHFYETTFN